ncbi:hypothetical protein BI364_15945 [Acidihalobacter yilgarnensis]|uniref:Cytochrome b561 bacterial/Ni-hydrogenase domain-containing protein n=1 Tax=Acidihalobacter yilgarnensis TaxID=2819280 RepID=A0A1D8IRQ7_9GAMM|nr:cytochrome b/b6 domain-containing protein [Acidihalobacter yilgarnensis]AOU99228.1 hypothetical protein BI364_15945 [Acidihalobacter yilgarnensis]
MNTPRPRSVAYRGLHWALAALVVAQWGDGWLFVHDEDVLGPKPIAIAIHASLGALTLACALMLGVWWVARRGWRTTLARDMEPDTGRWRGPAAVAVHATMLGLIVAEAALGLFGLELVGTPVRLFGAVVPSLAGTHIDLGLALLAWERHLGVLLALLVLLHVAAALDHHLRLRDDVLRRMSLLRGG